MAKMGHHLHYCRVYVHHLFPPSAKAPSANIFLDGTLGLTSVSGFGAVVGFLVPDLFAAGKDLDDVIHLIPYPPLFMGLVNFVSFPIALAIGCKSLFVLSLLLHVVALTLFATYNGY